MREKDRQCYWDMLCACAPWNNWRIPDELPDKLPDKCFGMGTEECEDYIGAKDYLEGKLAKRFRRNQEEK